MKDEKSFIGSLTDDKRHALTEALSNIDFSKAKLALEKVSRASEHAAKSKLITDFLQFIKDFSLEKAVRGLILKVAEEKLQRDGLDKDDARYLTEARTQFLSSFDATMGWCETPKQRQSALTAILSASAIGSHGQDQKALIQAVHKKLTESAHEARKAEPVQEIIEDRARGLWGRKMWFKDNDNGTASTILDDVNKDICKLQNDRPREVPQTWRVPGTPSKVWKEKAINRIAGRLKRIKCSDRQGNNRLTNVIRKNELSR